MRFLVFSDLHLHNWAYGSKPVQGWNSRLLFQHDVLGQIESYALERGIRTIVFCGDMFHTHSTLHAGPLSVAIRTFSRWKEQGLNVVFLVGNHDQSTKDGTIHALECLRPYGRVIDEPTTFQIGGTTFHARGYTDDASAFNSFLASAPVESVVLCHQGVANVKVGSAGYKPDSLLQPNKVPSGVKYVFSGHYHSYTKVSDQVYIPGTPLAHDWSDCGESRGWLDVDDDSVTFVESTAPKFVRIDMTGTKVIPDERLREMAEGNFVKLENFGHQNYAEARKAVMDVGAWAVEFPVELPVRNVPADVHADWDMQNLLHTFIEASDMEPQRQDIGHQLSSDYYETP